MGSFFPGRFPPNPSMLFYLIITVQIKKEVVENEVHDLLYQTVQLSMCLS